VSERPLSAMPTVGRLNFDLMASNTRSKRRSSHKLQLGLRTAILAFLLIGLLCVPIAWIVRLSIEERNAAKHVQDLGGVVVWDGHSVDNVTLPNNANTTEALLHLKKFRHMVQLDISSWELKDPDLVHLETLQSLKYMSLHAPKVSNKRADELRRILPNCEIYSHQHTVEFSP
jgi:hypothetical protein